MSELPEQSRWRIVLKSALAAVAVGLPLCPVAAGPIATIKASASEDIDRDVHEASIAELQRLMASGRATSRGIVEAYLRRIAAYDQAGPMLNSIVLLNPRALADADELDRERRNRRIRGPLHGIPILVKDNFDVAGMPTSGGTLALATLQATRDAFVVARLRRAGAVILGKTTMHELALGVTTVSSLTGNTRNPYDIRRSPGGSSGGSAAAVAASFAAAAMGTDTCGSIREPAAAQNLYGIRESMGLSSRSGIVPLSTTQDVAGPLARSVIDLATMMDAITGEDGDDPPTRGARRPAHGYAGGLRPGGFKGARIGVLKSMFDPDDADPETLKTLKSALTRIAAQGATLVDISIPGLDKAAQSANVTAFEFQPAFAEYLREHPGAPLSTLADIAKLGLDHEAVDDVVRRLMMPGDAAAYRQALDKRAVVTQIILDAMAGAKVDVMAYPVSPEPPLIWGASPPHGSPCRYSASTGLPAIAIPLGLSDAKLPVGLELLGRRFEEPRLLQLAFAWEQTAPPRAAPSSTPPLLHGKPPRSANATVLIREPGAAGARATVTFRYDIMTSSLDFDAHIRPRAGDAPVALTMHRGESSGFGPVVAILTRRNSRRGHGRIYVEPALRDDLSAGHVYLQLQTSGAPLGGSRVPIVLH